MVFQTKDGDVYLLDAESAHLAAKNWRTAVRETNKYAYRHTTRNGKKVLLFMHREVLGLASGDPPVDHINGNGLDNRRENLRPASTYQNARNVCAVTTSNQHSPFRGVQFIKATGRFRARVRHKGKNVSLGVYASAEEANAARFYAEERLWGMEPRRLAAMESFGVVPVKPETRPDWTREEKDFLAQNYDKGAGFVAKSLGRTKKAVYGMAHSMKKNIDGSREKSPEVAW